MKENLIIKLMNPLVCPANLERGEAEDG